MNTCQTSMKDRYIIVVLWYPPSSVPNTLEIITVAVPSGLTKVGKDMRTNNDLPTCTVDLLLKPSWILLVRIFQQSIHISKLQSFRGRSQVQPL